MGRSTLLQGQHPLLEAGSPTHTCTCISGCTAKAAQAPTWTGPCFHGRPEKGLSARACFPLRGLEKRWRLAPILIIEQRDPAPRSKGAS